MTDQWRLACPHNHRQVHRVGGETPHGVDTPRTWVCESCRDNDAIDGYRYDSVTDLKTNSEVSV
jgi:hypothetical protein